MFVHLHNHTHYSILEGLPKPKDYVEMTKKLGMTAVAITDTSCVYGCHELYQNAVKEGIKPILGTEIYVESVLESKISHKLVLLAKSLQGYRNIIELITIAQLNNPRGVPRIKFEDIKQLKEKRRDLEIVCLSGDIKGEIPFFILFGKTDEEILVRIKEYIELFGEENYYLELLYHDDIPKQNFVTNKLIEIANKYDLNVVATNNCYYLTKEDKQAQDVIIAIGTAQELENPDRPKMIDGDYSFLTEEEIQTLFGFIPRALEATVKIANMINIEIQTGQSLIPTYELPEEDSRIYNSAMDFDKKFKGVKKLTSDEWYLRYLSYKGLSKRYEKNLSKEIIFKLVQKLDKSGLEKKLTETSPEELKTLSLTYYSEEKKNILKGFDKDLQDKIERLEYELVVVHEMGFDAYFLIVADYINWAKNNGIPVGPGRGSAAGSLMAYLSGITDIDPLPYDLLFERFLNPARVSMPDIDTDFADVDRDKVVEYCRQKYGADRVAQICTFGTFAARAAVKDTGRTYGVEFTDMNKLAQLIPEKPGTKLKKALEESLDFKEAYDTNSKYKDIVDSALKIEGNVRQIGVHACAVIIAPQPMTNFTALQHPPKDDKGIITQYEAHALEDLGLLKMDFLGLRNLTIIKRTQEIIKSMVGKDIDILKLDLTDKKVFKVFAMGDTTGVFQFESNGMRKYLKELNPDNFEDLIAMVSLYRPGPLGYIPTYIDVKSGKKEKKYLTDDLKEILEKAKYSASEIEAEKKKLEEDLGPILDKTYGIPVYQEQLMFIVQYMAGFSLGEADLLRRGIGKKKKDVIEKLKIEFIEKGKNFRQYKPETTDYIYTNMIMPAADYSFNKSHATCYAFIAYQTAYLKAYYKTEFMTALMISDEENVDRIVAEVTECESLGISVLPPNVNQSRKHFTYMDNKTIRFGLKAVKGIGNGPIESIIKAREKLGGKFASLQEFIENIGKENVNKKTLESLIFSGAMDDFGCRKEMILGIGEMTKFSRRDEKKKKTSQIGLFDDSEDFKDDFILGKSEEFSFEEILLHEKEMLGFTISGHPLDGLKRYCIKRGQNLKRLRASIEELLKTLKSVYDKRENNGDKKRVRDEKVQAVGVIVEIRKINTKTGKTMMFLGCEGFDYDFEAIIFPRSIQEYKDKIDLNKIVIVNGFLSVNVEYKRKSVSVQDMKILTITEARNQAKEFSLFDNSKRPRALFIIEEENTNLPNETILVENENVEQEVIEENEELEKFTIKIPDTSKIEDLQELKNFMQTLETGKIRIFREFKGNKKATEFSIKDLGKLKEWVKGKWKI